MDRRLPAPPGALSPSRRTRHRIDRRALRRALAAVALVGGTLATGSLAACAGGGAPETTPSPSTGTTSTGAAAAQQRWSMRTAEHVDLWLHGFAMLLDDTSRVPLFRRGYRDEIRAAKSRASVVTQLDAERDRLRQRFAASPQLALQAQFLALSFPSWDEMRRAVGVFLQAEGNPQRAGDQQTAAVINFLAQNFRTAAEREWLRIFTNALADEYDRFYHRYWMDTQRDRAAALAAADDAWQRTVRPRITRFLDNTVQRDGVVLLSLPLDGEGRTSSGSSRDNTVTVGFPARTADALDASYAVVHEVTGSLAATAVSDHVTPAEQREGVASRYASAAQVRAGHLLLQRAAPELADGYARYYLRSAGLAETRDPAAALAAAFPLPQTIVDALARQLDLTLGGI